MNDVMDVIRQEQCQKYMKSKKSGGGQFSLETTVIRRCSTCRWAGNEYKLTNESYYPKTGIFIQCNVKLSEDFRKQLPFSFYRKTAIYVGWVDETGNKYNNNGDDCPTWETKKAL